MAQPKVSVYQIKYFEASTVEKLIQQVNDFFVLEADNIDEVLGLEQYGLSINSVYKEEGEVKGWFKACSITYKTNKLPI